MKDMNETIDYSALLSAYRTLWVNRPLPASNEKSKQVLLEIIGRDLRDENTHPRARKNPYVKFYLATMRIADSKMNDEKKMELMKIHINIFENLENN